MASAEEPRAGVRIAYLCSLYPAISHTFILREIEALRARGVQIETCSIHRAGAEQLLSDAERRAAESTFAILPPRWAPLLSTHLRLALRAPRAYLSTLALALRLASGGARGRLWQLFYFAEAVVLWARCRRLGVRHVHAHIANVAADVALLAASLGCAVEGERRWSWSFTMHGPTEFFDVGHFRLAQKVERAKFVICISDFARSQLMALSDTRDWRKLHVVHCGVPLEDFGGDLPASDTSSEPPTILCVGRLVPEKGQAILLQALALLRDSGRRVCATLVGEGDERDALEALANRLGLAGQVRFTGALGQREVRTLYAEASLFCLPSFAEGVPCVLMEAMAMGVPVVSTQIAGIPELIEDDCGGLLIAPGRPDLLALAIERLLSDPELCRRLSMNARRKVAAEFDIERSAEQLLEIFTGELGVGKRSAQARGRATVA